METETKRMFQLLAEVIEEQQQMICGLCESESRLIGAIRDQRVSRERTAAAQQAVNAASDFCCRIT
jgi:hypothetical protein